MSKHNGFLKYTWFLAPAVLLVFAAGCSTLHVQTDYAHNVNFSQFHTYSWLRVHARNDLWVNRIKRDVNAQLTAKGWTQVPYGGQTVVAAFSATHNEPTLETFYDSFGPGFGGWGWWGWGGGFNEGYSYTQVVNTPIGSLVVDVFNARTQKLIWRGVSTQALSGNAVTNKHKLAHAVNKMFQNFPPGTQG